MKASDRDLVLRFGSLGFVWKADSRRIELVQASDEGVPAPEKPAAIALLEPYHYLEGMKNVQRDEADFRIFCEEFLQGMATAEIVDETPAPSPQRQRAELVLGYSVHPAALDRLFELWPTAHVVVRHSDQFNDGVPIKVTHIEVWNRPPGEAGAYPERGIAKCRLDVDSWERRRGIGLAFKRALLRVKQRAIEEAS